MASEETAGALQHLLTEFRRLLKDEQLEVMKNYKGSDEEL